MISKWDRPVIHCQQFVALFENWCSWLRLEIFGNIASVQWFLLENKRNASWLQHSFRIPVGNLTRLTAELFVFLLTATIISKAPNGISSFIYQESGRWDSDLMLFVSLSFFCSLTVDDSLRAFLKIPVNLYLSKAGIETGSILVGRFSSNNPSYSSFYCSSIAWKPVFSFALRP